MMATADHNESRVARWKRRRGRTSAQLGAVKRQPRRRRSAASFVAPRSGTKIDTVVKMLSRPEGATLAALVEATGWLPHSTYAALTGLRKRGYVLGRVRDEKAGPSVYRMMRPGQAEG